jgi:hypothetical protein
VAWDAIEVVVTTIPSPGGPIDIRGTVEASGGGGQRNGAGGGSGGSVLLEAPRVLIDGMIRAKGGGGACRDAAGADGRLDGTGCTPVDPAQSSGGTGGGTWASFPAEILFSNGTSGENLTLGEAGGGGGGTGRVRIQAAGTAPGVELASKTHILAVHALGFIEVQ